MKTTRTPSWSRSAGPEGPQCPFCGTFNVDPAEHPPRVQVQGEGMPEQFTVKRGMIFENGISSYEIARDLDVCKKTAWFVLHHLRRAMKAGSFDKSCAASSRPMKPTSAAS
jgi:hypothetical protein